MANHVHVLLLPKVLPSRLMQSLKGSTARQSNLVLGRTARQSNLVLGRTGEAFLASRVLRPWGAR